MKRCSKCSIEKDANSENFPPNKNSKDGLYSWCRVCSRSASHKWKQENKKRVKATKARWYSEHREQVNTTTAKWHTAARRGEKGELAQLKLQIHGLIINRINRHGYTKRSRTHQLLGCSYSELLIHLGPKPTPDAHIDHIAPCSIATNEEELLKLQHYTNFRWLPATDNLEKSDKWTPEGAEMCLQLLGREWAVEASTFNDDLSVA